MSESGEKQPQDASHATTEETDHEQRASLELNTDLGSATAPRASSVEHTPSPPAGQGIPGIDQPEENSRRSSLVQAATSSLHEAERIPAALPSWSSDSIPVSRAPSPASSSSFRLIRRGTRSQDELRRIYKSRSRRRRRSRARSRTPEQEHNEPVRQIGPVRPEEQEERDNASTYESEGFSDGTIGSGASLAPSSVDVDTIAHAEAVRNLARDLQEKFTSHRCALRRALCDLKDKEDGRRLYSDAEIDAQLMMSTASVGSEPELPRDGEDGIGEAAFGYRATVGHFKMAKTVNAEIDFQDDQIPMSNVGDWIAEKEQPLQEHQTGVAWVHLPVNNLSWVKVRTILTLRKFLKSYNNTRQVSTRPMSENDLKPMARKLCFFYGAANMTMRPSLRMCAIGPSDENGLP